MNKIGYPMKKSSKRAKSFMYTVLYKSAVLAGRSCNTAADHTVYTTSVAAKNSRSALSTFKKSLTFTVDGKTFTKTVRVLSVSKNPVVVRTVPSKFHPSMFHNFFGKK